MGISCKDDPLKGGGPYSDRSDAKAAAIAACGSVSNINWEPPHADYDNADGTPSYSLVNLENVMVDLTNEINLDQFLWYIGMDCIQGDLSSIDKAIAQLKIWDVFKGGSDRASIEQQHNLTSGDYDKLVARMWQNGSTLYYR